MNKTIHVFGDTGGHSLPLWRALTNLGVDLETGYIPEEIQIIHLGDLIHKGPNTDGIVSVVDKLIRKNPGRWIQILGNHEFQHIEGSPYFWTCKCSDETIETINTWFEEGHAAASYALTEPHKIANIKNLENQTSSPILFTHAGLTYDWWKAIDKPEQVSAVESILNTLPVEIITTPGLLLGVQNSKPGPVWAIGNTEVFQSWTGQKENMPFTQIHGHTSSFSWRSKQWWIEDPEFRSNTTVDKDIRAIITELNNNLLIGIDPGFSKTADIPVQPYLKIVKP